MQAKVIEIRDVATCIPALVIRQAYPLDRRSVNLLARAGFGTDFDGQLDYVFLIRLSDQEAHYDPYRWPNRTMRVAHQHAIGEWDTLEDGSVVDVEFLEGESEAPKPSEVNTDPRAVAS